MKISVVPLRLFDSEVVERKGIGHPDTLADGIAEAVSIALCKEYVKKYGEVQHHNVDKVTIVAGQSHPAFGGGEIIKPIEIILVGRAHYGIAVEKIATAAAKDYFESVIDLAEDGDFIIVPKIGEGAKELVSTVEKVVSNDTSVGVGFYPFTKAEQLSLEIADFLNSKEFRKEWPEVGTDVKVMVNRIKDDIEVTIAAAFIDRFLDDISAYRRSKETIEELLKDKFGVKSLRINALDDYESGNVYLTVLGTSAEQGDDGATGRGNRVMGFIAPMRPMSMEATAGKNPISHVGKIYNALAQKIAERIYAETNKGAEVILRSTIGDPLDDPSLVIVRTEASSDDVEAIVKDELASIDSLIRDLTKGKVRLF